MKIGNSTSLKRREMMNQFQVKQYAHESLVKFETGVLRLITAAQDRATRFLHNSSSNSVCECQHTTHSPSERGDVPGWVLVVLMTTGLVTAIWTIAAPRLSAILKNSLDAMNGIR